MDHLGGGEVYSWGTGSPSTKDMRSSKPSGSLGDGSFRVTISSSIPSSSSIRALNHGGINVLLRHGRKLLFGFKQQPAKELGDWKAQVEFQQQQQQSHEPWCEKVFAAAKST
jgi:hypothetical protein